MSALAEEYARFQAEGGWADLSARTKLRLTGADRIRYLNGQTTADITRWRPGQSLPACIVSAKGKLNAVVHISGDQESLLLDAEPELRESLLARLERYLVADDVTVEDVTESLALAHLFLPGTPALPFPQSRRFGRPGVDIFLPREQWDHLRQSQFDHLRLLSPELLETLRIEGGQPRWGAELGEDTLPPEAGLDRTHIDYQKGCYMGQEIISRLKSVGHVNRDLRGFQAMEDLPLAAGLRLFAPGALEKQIGVLTSAAWSFALAKPIALGYLRRGSPEGPLLALPATGVEPPREVVACELPFAAVAAVSP